MSLLDKTIAVFSPERNRSSFLPVRSHDRLPTERIDILIALAPAVFWSVHAYGTRSLLVILVCVASALLADVLCSFAFSGSLHNCLDLSAVTHSVILALFLSPNADLVHAMLATLAATVFFKNLLGRFTRLKLHPSAAVLSVFALLGFASESFACRYPFGGDPGMTVPELVALSDTQALRWYEIFFGSACAPLGCASALLLIAGGIYLAVRKIINIKIPLAYVLGICVAAYFLSANANPFEDVVFLGVCGQTHLAAFFLASDRSFAPHSKRFSFFYGAVCGAIAAYLCFKLSPTAAFLLSILIGNIGARITDLFPSDQRPFGKVEKAKPKDKNTSARSDKPEETVDVSADDSEVSNESTKEIKADTDLKEDGGDTAEDEVIEDEAVEDETAEDETAEDETAEDETAEDETVEDETAEDENSEAAVPPKASAKQGASKKKKKKKSKR